MKRLNALVTICLTAISLVSCDSAPDLHPKLVDARRDRFLVHELTNKENFTFSTVGWVKGIENLDGHYCFSSGEIANYNSWARRQAERLKSCEAAR